MSTEQKEINEILHPRRHIRDYNSALFSLYNKYNNSEAYLQHCLNINVSKFIFKKFIPSLYVSYLYDTKSSFNFAYIPQKAFNKYNLKYNLVRDYNELKFFNPEEDFVFEKVPNSVDQSKYIKHIKNKNIRKISTQQYLLKNLSRWILVDPDDNSKILGIYKIKSEIPEDKIDLAIEIIAKPKIIIRMFKNLKTNSLLIQFIRFFYNVDTLQFVNYKSKFEFTRYSLPVYVEITTS